MSDLISRRELLEAFNNKNIQITFDLPVEEILGEDVDLDDFAMLVQDAIQAYKKMVIDTIKNQHTAYDVDKVVDELNKASYRIDDSATLSSRDVVDIEDAIESVKHGGVTEDVCEWKLTDTQKLMPYKTYCGNEDLYDSHYKYCPYCGKKIRVVGD